MKKVIALMMALSIASAAVAIQEIAYVENKPAVKVADKKKSQAVVDDSSPIITTAVTSYSMQESAAYFNNSLVVRVGSWLNKVVSQNWDHQNQLSTMHKVVMPVKVVVTNKTHNTVYLPVTGWATGFDYSYNPASLATVYPKQWTQFAVSGALTAFGALVAYATVDQLLRNRRLPLASDALMIIAGAYAAYSFNQCWKGRTTSNALRALKPRIVRTVEGQPVEFDINLKTVNDVLCYELPGDSVFETMLFVPRVNDFKLKVDVKTAA